MSEEADFREAVPDTRPQDVTRGVVCGRCGHWRLKVVYTRRAPGGRIVRRRECRRCGHRLTTWEREIGKVQMRNESAPELQPSTDGAASSAIPVDSGN